MTDFTVGSSVITSSEADENAGVFFDDYRKVRVLQPEAEHQALELKDECKEFLESKVLMKSVY